MFLFRKDVSGNDKVAYRKMDYRVIEGEEKQFVYVDSRYENVLERTWQGKDRVYAYFTLCAPGQTDEISKKNLGLVKLRYVYQRRLQIKHG